MKKLIIFVSCLLLTAFSYAKEKQVVIIPVKGEIEEGLAHIVKRAIKEAKLKNADAIILDMDTFGGKVNAAEKIMQSLSKCKMPTYTYVNTKAISAGALIASATKYIYMSPQSQIGDAKIMQMSPIPFGGAKEIDKGMKEKAYSAVRAIVRSACEQNNHPYHLFEAMMDEEISISNLIEKSKLLTLTANEAVTQKLAVAVANSLDQMIDLAGYEGAEKKYIKPKAGEHLARFFSSMVVSGILLMIGLGGLFIEIKTPGFGVPGIIGIVCLVLFFWGHYTANITGWLPAIMFIVGTVLLILEIFVIPGFGLAGISGIALMIASLILALIDWVPGDWANAPTLNDVSAAAVLVAVSIAGAITIIIVAARFLPKTPVVRSFFLSDNMDKAKGYAAFNEKEYDKWLGKTGVAKTDLRPAGKAVIDDKLLDVVTQGDFIEKNSNIKVVEVNSNHIIVNKV